MHDEQRSAARFTQDRYIGCGNDALPKSGAPYEERNCVMKTLSKTAIGAALLCGAVAVGASAPAKAQPVNFGFSVGVGPSYVAPAAPYYGYGYPAACDPYYAPYYCGYPAPAPYPYYGGYYGPTFSFGIATGGYYGGHYYSGHPYYGGHYGGVAHYVSGHAGGGHGSGGHAGHH